MSHIITHLELMRHCRGRAKLCPLPFCAVPPVLLHDDVAPPCWHFEPPPTGPPAPHSFPLALPVLSVAAGVDVAILSTEQVRLPLPPDI